MGVVEYPAGAAALRGAVGLDPSIRETNEELVVGRLGRYPGGAAPTQSEVRVGGVVKAEPEIETT